MLIKWEIEITVDTSKNIEKKFLQGILFLILSRTKVIVGGWQKKIY